MDHETVQTYATETRTLTLRNKNIDNQALEPHNKQRAYKERESVLKTVSTAGKPFKVTTEL